MKIYQKKISKNHNDSFWYDGNIAQIGKYLLRAIGDIEILFKEGGYAFARGKHYSDEVFFKNDKELYKKVGISYSDNLYWEHNNWLEVINKENGEGVLGNVVYTYDEGIKLLKQCYKEKIYD